MLKYHDLIMPNINKIKVDSKNDEINILIDKNSVSDTIDSFKMELNLDKDKKNLKTKKSTIDVNINGNSNAIINPENIPKRRGRKPKKMLEQPTKPIDFDLLDKQDDTIITLHLPINLNNKSKNKNIPVEESDESIDLNQTSEEDIFGKNDTSEEKPCHNCIERDQIIKFQKQKIEQMETELKKEKRERKAYYTNVNMFDIIDSKPVLAQKTNVACMWDCHSFDTIPCFLPELYYQNNYYVRSICFCSFNCALAYNIYQLNDSKVSERKSLVLSICRKIYANESPETLNELLHESPPRECLQMFGGKKTIEEFRLESKTMDKKYIVLLPPIQPLFTIIQEDCSDESIIDPERKQEKTKYALERKSPLIKNNSLVSSMGLTIKNTKK
jgi:hypothetical protein